MNLKERANAGLFFQRHKFFEHVNWEATLKKAVKPPFEPTLVSKPFHIHLPIVREMDNPGEVSQILSGITFDRNNIF